MNLYNKLVADMRASMKANDAELTGSLRIIVGELQRQDTSNVSDEEVIKVLRKLMKSEQENLEMTKSKSSRLLDVVTGYVPAMATDEEIKVWVRNNVDFSKLKNKMVAMKDIMAHFGARVDGNTAKRILLGSE